MKAEKDFVCYEEFGAVGDGIHDDMPAIAACHEYANEKRLAVRAKDGAEYYIGKRAITVKIMTDTYFGSAKFTIDDRLLEDHAKPCFDVCSSYEPFTPEITSVKAGQKKIDFPHEGDVFVRLSGDPEHRVYIRKGLNMNEGTIPADNFIVDKDGNVLTQINWDYPVISEAWAKRVDDEPITIEGGVFTTISNQWICEYNAHERGFLITRSNVTIKNLLHLTKGELPDHGAPYGGFMNIGRSYNVTLENVTLTPRKAYQMESYLPGQMVWMGTYDLGMGNAIATKLINLKQTLPLDEPGYWGVMGTNFCKDMYIEGCDLSRFDAHCGITNCTIKNSTLAGLNLIGFGRFVIEDSVVTATQFIRMRPDYGSFFKGDIEIKNCVWRPEFSKDLTLITAFNEGDHYFGYDCKLADTITVDGLEIDDSKCPPDKKVFLFSSYDNNFEKGKPYPYAVPDKITVRNAHVASGKKIEFAVCPEQFEDCEAEFV